MSTNKCKQSLAAFVSETCLFCQFLPERTARPVNRGAVNASSIFQRILNATYRRMSRIKGCEGR